MPEAPERPAKRARHGEPPQRWCVAVHVGAGYHKPELEANWRATLTAACAAAAAVLATPPLGAPADWASHNDFIPAAMRAVTAALASLEDDERTNAGLGSNLTEGGYVEADASVMIDRDPPASASLPRQHNPAPRWAALAAVPGVRNPSLGAHRLLSSARDLTAQPSLGRIPPVLLSGDGGRRWCAGQQLATVGQETPLSVYQVTDEARRQWRWCQQQEEAQRAAAAAQLQSAAAAMAAQSSVTAAAAGAAESAAGWVARSDTVGAVVIDQFGRVAAGASSGGVMYLLPARQCWYRRVPPQHCHWNSACANVAWSRYKPDGRVGSAACCNYTSNQHSTTA